MIFELSYLSHFSGLLIAFPLSAAMKPVSQITSFQRSDTLIIKKTLIDGIDEWSEIDQEPLPNEQVMALTNNLNKKNEQLEEKVAKFQSMIPINAIDQNQMMSFLSAAKKGQLKIAELLKKRGANIYATDERGNNALHLACLFLDSLLMVTWLLDVCKIDIEAEGQYQTTPFLCAAQKGQLAIAKLLRKRGANINAKSDGGNNSLHAACLYSDSVVMVTWLLDVCQIDIETKGFAQRTPFLCAAEKGQLAIAKLLRERGVNIHAKDKWGDNALHLACLYSGSVEMVTWLLDVCGMGLETKGYYKKTPFLNAAEEGQLKIAKLLKRRSAKINAKSSVGDNALHLACYFSGSVEMVTWLLDVCKLGLETQTQNQRTPFLCAVEKGQLGIAKLLRERGANIHVKNAYGNNALQLAKIYARKEMISHLKKWGVR